MTLLLAFLHRRALVLKTAPFVTPLGLGLPACFEGCVLRRSLVAGTQPSPSLTQITCTQNDQHNSEQTTDHQDATSVPRHKQGQPPTRSSARYHLERGSRCRRVSFKHTMTEKAATDAKSLDQNMVDAQKLPSLPPKPQFSSLSAAQMTGSK